MSGHITRMSRGSSVGSSSSSPTSTSRSTSTWRAAPWQACTCRLTVVGRRLPGGPAVGVGSPVGAQVGLEPAEQRGPARRAGRAQPPRRRRRRGPGCSSRVSRPREASSGWRDALGGRVVVARDGTPPIAGAGRPRAPARAGAATGGRRAARRARASSSTSVTGSRVWPNSESRSGRSRRDAAASPSRSSTPSRVAHVGRRLARRGRAAGATAPVCQSRSASSGRAGAVGVAARAPVGDERRPLHGVRREDAGQPARHRPAASPAEVALVAGDSRGRGGGRGWPPTARRGSRRGPRAAATPAGRGPTGRRARGRAAARRASAG